MKILKRILLIIVFCLIAFLLIGHFIPRGYEISRSVIIDASPADVHEYVGNLEKWDKWSPWLEKDPEIKITRGEITRGVGATQSWSDQNGNGSLVFTASDPEKGVEYDLRFNDGKFECKSQFEYIPKGDQTEVVWNMHGEVKTALIGGYLARKMDSFVGPDFEMGLEKLIKVVEENQI